MDLYEGVNALLNAIGEIPITDNTQAIEAEVTSDVGLARDTLLRISKALQEEGYWFNKEIEYPLVPNTDGLIPIGSSVLSVVSQEYIVKDHKLYDVVKRSYEFDTIPKVTIVFEVAFDDLPSVVADTIVREAQVEFYNNVFGDTQELNILRQNAQRAQIQFQKAQLKHRRPNLIKGSRLVSRTQNPTGVS